MKGGPLKLYPVQEGFSIPLFMLVCALVLCVNVLVLVLSVCDCVTVCMYVVYLCSCLVLYVYVYACVHLYGAALSL